MQADALVRYAETYATPLYVYDAERIRTQYRKLSAVDAKLFYAMKANYNPDILRVLLDLGAGIDAVSLGDVLLARKIGFSKERILYTANRTRDEELDQVYQMGVLCNLGSLSQLARFARRHPGARVCVRLNPMIQAGEHERVVTAGENSKFGVPLTRLSELLGIVAAEGLNVVGVHEHAGSGIPESVEMIKGMENVLAVLDRFPDLEFVDFGGGFKVAYAPGEAEFDHKRFAAEVNARFAAACGERDLEMRFEPGKYLVAQAGTLLVTVTDVTATPHKILVGVDSGFPQLIRPMFYGAYHRIENLSNPNGERHLYDVVGNICESGDSFATERPLPEVREGDVLAIRDAGAYCASMGGVYNQRPMPAELLVDTEDRFRRAATFHELAEAAAARAE